jgi:hypothetical protein
MHVALCLMLREGTKILLVLCPAGWGWNGGENRHRLCSSHLLNMQRLLADACNDAQYVF